MPSLTYEKVQRLHRSQLVQVLTSSSFETAAIKAGVISTNSGNDSVQFLGGAKNYVVNLGAGADSLYGAEVISISSISGGAGQDTFLISTLSNAIIYGGGAADSISVTGSLQGGTTIDFGAGNEVFTLSVGASNCLNCWRHGQ